MGQQQYRKVSGFIEKKVGGELVLVPMAETVAQMSNVFTLNEIGSFIYENLEEAKTEKEICELLTEEFEVEEKVAEKDLDLFLKDALTANVIEKLEKDISTK